MYTCIFAGTFFLCWGPYVLLNLWSVNNDHLSVPYAAEMTTLILAFSNSAVNPYVFALLDRDFRSAWVNIILCYTCRHRTCSVSLVNDRDDGSDTRGSKMNSVSVVSLDYYDTRDSIPLHEKKRELRGIVNPAFDCSLPGQVL